MNSTIAITAAAGTTVETFVEAAAKGTVKFYTIRENGTYRHIPFLGAGTVEREVAEWVAMQREEGVTMKAIAAEMHLSVPSVRRVLNSLLLTQEVEEYDTDDIATILAEQGETVTGTVVEEATPAASPQASPEASPEASPAAPQTVEAGEVGTN